MKWVGYSLDGKKNMTITGNSTIVNLTNDLHSITVYANDTSENMGTSETINFTIVKQELFPTASIAIVSVVVIVVVVTVVGLLVYHKKHKSQLSKGSLTTFSQESCTRSLLLKAGSIS
jgi:hypothetical protein